MNSENQILDVKQLAIKIHMTPAGVRNRMIKGRSMPPSFKMPDGKKTLFYEKDVDAWLVATAIPDPSPAARLIGIALRDVK